MSREELTDKILVIKARLGDKQAFASIYNKYVSKLYRFAYYKTSSKELAEDIVSQTFLKAWERVVVGGQIRSLQALLYKITRNLIIDYYRSKQSTEVSLEYDLGEKDEPRQELHANIDQDLIKQAVSSIENSDHKEIIILRYIEDLSIREIAKILDKSPGNVRIVCHRAITELKERLKDYR